MLWLREPQAMGDTPGPLPSPGCPDSGLREQGSGAPGRLPSERSPSSVTFMTVTQLGPPLLKPAPTAAHPARRLPPTALSSHSRFASLNSTESLGFLVFPPTPLWSLGEGSEFSPDTPALASGLCPHSPPDFELRKSTFLHQFRPEETGTFQRSFY